MKIVLIIVTMFTFFITSNAKLIKVVPDNNSFNNALGKSIDGDTILLAPGTYQLKQTINIDKAITIASNYIYSHEEKSINNTIFKPLKRDMHEWFELSAKNAKVIGFTFMGNENHTLNITASYAYVEHCKFYGGKDQLSFSGGGGYVGYCYFENAGDDALDCDNSIDWIIEHNIIVNAFQDGIEIRLHDKNTPLTKHHFRYNFVVGAGESGIQLIDYKGDSYREFYINNNLFQNCQGSGVSCMYKEKDNTNEVYRGSLMKETAFVYNNTFSSCNYGLTISPGLLILNNIFLNIKTTAICRGIYVDDISDLSIVDYSCFYKNGKNFDGGVILGENNLIDFDPELDPSLMLKKDNPLIDRGTAKYEWRGKKLNLTKSEYLGANPDLGCFEYGAETEKISIPIVSVGKDIVLLYPNNKTILDGIIYENGAKTINRIKWEKIDGPGSVKFSDKENFHTTIELSKQGIYKIKLSGYDNKSSFSDELKIYYVKDFSNKHVTVGRKNDIIFNADKYKYIVGDASVAKNRSSALTLEQNAYSYYQISTKYAGTYYVWLHAAVKKGGNGLISVSFDDLNNEKNIKINNLEGNFGFQWKKVRFDNIPEGYYPLIIKAKKSTVIFDKVFITIKADKRPF